MKLNVLAKKILVFSAPIIGTSFLNMLAGFIGLMFVARVSTVDLAASSLAVTSFVMLWTMSACLLYSVGIMVGYLKGASVSKNEIGLWVKNGIILALAISIVIGGVIYNFDRVLLIFGQDYDLVSLTKNYFHYAAFFLMPALISMVLFQFFIGIGMPKVTLITYTLRLPIVIFFFYLFILGNFGFKKMGLGGLSFSLLLVQIIECFSVLCYVSLNKKFIDYGITKKTFLLNKNICKKLLSIGFPIGFQFGGELAAITIITYMMGKVGTDALVANQIVSQFIVLFTMLTMGLTQSISVLVSEANGMRNKAIISKYYYLTTIILLTCLLFVFLVFVFDSNLFLSFYIDVSDKNNSKIIELSKVLFFIGFGTIIFDGLRNVLSGVLRGLHDSKTPMYISLSCLWIISIPLAWFLSFNLRYGACGLRFGFAAGIIIGTLLIYRRYRKFIFE